MELEAFVWGQEGREVVRLSSIITIGGERKKKINLQVTEKGAELRFCVESSDSSGRGGDWDKCSRNGVLLPHRWSIVCQHQSARKWENSPFICSWFIEDAATAAFECLEPTALSRGPVGLGQFIFFFIRWESVVLIYMSIWIFLLRKKHPTSVRPLALPGFPKLEGWWQQRVQCIAPTLSKYQRRSPHKQIEAASHRRFCPRILHKHRTTDDFTLRWNAPARRRKGK